MLRIFLTIAVSAATCQKSFSKLTVITLIKNYLRSSMSTFAVEKSCLTVYEQQLTDEINFDIAIEEFANKNARNVTV